MISLRAFLKGILLQNDADRTKQLAVQVLPGATTGTTTTINASQTVSRTLTLPDITGTLSTAALTETLTNKSIDGGANTLSNVAITSLKTVLADASKFVARDASGAIVSANSVPTGTVVGTSDTQTLTSKSIDASANTLTNIANASIAPSAAIAVNKLASQTASRAVATDASGFLTPSATTSAELAFVSGVTSSIQTQLNTKTSSGTLTDKHATRANGTGAIQDSLMIISDTGDVSNIPSVTLSGGGLSISSNTVQSNSSSALRLTTNIASQNVYSDRAFLLTSPQSGIPGSIGLRQDIATGTNVATLQPATLTANRTLIMPDATTTIVGTDATQTLTNKTFADAVTDVQVTTPATPAAGKNKRYFKADNRLYTLNSSGVEKAVTNLTTRTLTTLDNPTAADDLLLLNTTSANFVVNLFTAVGNSGKVIYAKKTSADANFATFLPNGAETIEGAANYRVSTQFEEVALVSDGANWQVLSKSIPPTVQNSNSAFSQTVPAVSDTWHNLVGNNVTIGLGIWELTATINYTNNGSNPGYGNKYGYWCAATGSNTSTNPAALSTLGGITVLGGYTQAFIANSSTDLSSVVVMPTLIVQSVSAGNTIYVGTRAVASTIANSRIIPVITAKRIG